MSYNPEYYLKHKEEYKERSKKWRKENKERFYEIVYNYRKRKADELREKGERYVWHSETKRKKLYDKRNRRINKNIAEREIQDNNNE